MDLFNQPQTTSASTEPVPGSGLDTTSPHLGYPGVSYIPTFTQPTPVRSPTAAPPLVPGQHLTTWDYLREGSYINSTPSQLHSPLPTPYSLSSDLVSLTSYHSSPNTTSSPASPYIPFLDPNPSVQYNFSTSYTPPPPRAPHLNDDPVDEIRLHVSPSSSYSSVHGSQRQRTHSVHSVSLPHVSEQDVTGSYGQHSSLGLTPPVLPSSLGLYTSPHSQEHSVHTHSQHPPQHSAYVTMVTDSSSSTSHHYGGMMYGGAVPSNFGSCVWDDALKSFHTGTFFGTCIWFKCVFAQSYPWFYSFS
ncbi:hypothetical protein VKT23_020641 [Stygiomarasmius scandens]|uniref:Uncharacterized protein n=1 Tax=Marasmiellus scandens TaxID=2682957 RepID=A0ABR1IIN7_9AGAR